MIIIWSPSLYRVYQVIFTSLMMETIDIDGVSYRYYVMGHKMGFDEDETREFKGHLNFTKEQIPPYAHDPYI